MVSFRIPNVKLTVELPVALSFQAHPWFRGIEWNKLYQMKAAFIPEVNDELDTQNFEKFEEVFSLYDYAQV